MAETAFKVRLGCLKTSDVTIIRFSTLQGGGVIDIVHTGVGSRSESAVSAGVGIEIGVGKILPSPTLIPARNSRLDLVNRPNFDWTNIDPDSASGKH